MLKFRSSQALPLLALALGAGFANACKATPPVPADSAQVVQYSAVRDSVQSLLNEFTARMNAKEMEALGALYSNDSTFFWIEAAGLRYRSVKDIREGLQSLTRISEIEFKFYETRIDVLSPTIATVRTEFSQTFVEGTSKGTTYGGYMTITVVREADGWKFRNGHTSSRFPRPGV
jgi:ketosteroid isomerase-like protein